jgi:hypothetical protein
MDGGRELIYQAWEIDILLLNDDGWEKKSVLHGQGRMV